MSVAPVSVVVPVFNGARYLGEALQSLVDQTLPPAEIVVVDDGSTDGSADVAASFGDRLRVIRQDNRGVAAARNLGMSAASQRYIAWLDHDDIAMPQRLELQLAAFHADPAPDIVFGGMSQFVSPDLSEEARAQLRCDERIQPTPLPSCFMAPAAIFDKIGLLRTDTDATFVDWYLKAMENDLRIVFVPQLIARRRIHQGNQSYRNPQLRRDYIRLIKASLERRRLATGEKG